MDYSREHTENRRPRRSSQAYQQPSGRHALSPEEKRSRRSTPERSRSRRTAEAVPAQKALGKRYIPALDGLRTLAVLAVMGYHLGITWCNGGLLGVTVFFVLSGYLITGLLANEFESTGTINLPQFWLRRIRRLFPAIVLVVLCTIFLCVLFNHVLLTKMRPDILPSLFWAQNWWYIFRDLSYFEALGDPSPLTHFWSLAIEEQFYVVWPLLIFGAYKLGGGREFIKKGCLILSVVSVLLMLFLYSPEADPTRVYYGTDTRAFSLLIGAWLALAWPGAQLSEESVSETPAQSVRMLDAVGGVALLGLLVMLCLVDGMGAFMYRGGILLASLLTAVVIAALVHPRSLLARFFQLKPLVWLGQRSYGMYLWHYPLFLLLKPYSGTTHGYSVPIMVLGVVLTIAFAALSYQFIENPIRHGAIGQLIQKAREGQLFGLDGFTRSKKIAMGVVSACLVVTIGGCTLVPDTQLVPEDAIVSTGDAVDQAINIEKAEPFDMILLGDSVPGDIDDDYLQANIPNSLNDSYKGRWFFQARDIYRQYNEQGVVGPVVVFACFSNFMLEDGDLDKMFDLVGPDKDIFVVNTQCDEDFVDDTNDKLAAFCETHPNVHLVDWASLVRQHMDEYLWADKTHLRPEGSVAYVDLLKQAVNPYLETYHQDKAEAEQRAAEEAEAAAKKRQEEALANAKPHGLLA